MRLARHAAQQLRVELGGGLEEDGMRRDHCGHEASAHDDGNRVEALRRAPVELVVTHDDVAVHGDERVVQQRGAHEEHVELGEEVAQPVGEEPRVRRVAAGDERLVHAHVHEVVDAQTQHELADEVRAQVVCATQTCDHPH